MLTPSEFGLPEKFTEFRESQFEIAAKVTASPKYAYMLDAPTGVGKSLIAATVQKLMEKKILYICTTKQLQDQLLHDFPYARTLKGRGNYVCLKYKNMYPRVTAEECSNTEINPCEQLAACPYMVAKREALMAPLAVLNTSYFLTEANYVGTFSDQEMIVVDEADTLEDHLMSFVDVTITQKQLDQLQLDPPKFKTKFESWVEWANDAADVLKPRLVSLQRELEGTWATIDFDLMKEEKRLSRLLAKLLFFIREVDKNWVWFPQESQWSFKPVWVAKYAENSFWKHTKKVLMMSATILDYMQVSRNIGLDVMKVAYKALPSPFPKENRPVYLDYAATVTNKTMQEALPKLVVKVRKIMEDHPDDKILCLAEGTLIKTSTGYVPIEEVVAGDLVLTHMGRFRKVTKTFKRRYNSSMVRVKPVGSSSFLITPDHPCAVLDMGSLSWVESGSLEAMTSLEMLYAPEVARKLRKTGAAGISGSRLLTPIILDKPAGTKPAGIKLGARAAWPEVDTGSLGFWYCVGAWAAEGFLGSSNQVKWASVQIPYSIEIINNAIKAHMHAWYSKSTQCVICTCKELGMWLEHEVGRGACNKRVPSYLFSDAATEEQIDAFVDGYLEGDSSKRDPDRKEVWGSVSPQLALGIRDLLRKHTPTINVNSRGGWYGSINRVSECGSMRSIDWTYVRSIETVAYDGFVYNLGVEEDESYCLDLVCVHNCHTVSYKIRDYLMQYLDKSRTMTHSTFDRNTVLEAYKRSPHPKVLLSPSMDRGVDLPDDQCRVVIITKCPYPDLGDPQISKRVHASRDGNQWYAHKTISKIIQMAGRAVRSKDDWADTYILDEKFDQLYSENRRMFPKWFREAIIK